MTFGSLPHSRVARATRGLVALLALACAAPAFGADTASSAAATSANPAKKVKVLVLTQSRGFVHNPVKRPSPDELALSEKTMKEIGEQTGVFEAEATQDATVITPEKLKETDVLLFYTTGALPISDENWAAVQEWLSSGRGGFIGIHSATDTGWKYEGEGLSYPKMINGQFAGHPWNQGTPVSFTAIDPEHPTVRMWGPEFDYKEEIYQYKDYDEKAVRVLQYMNFEKTPRKMPYMVPLTWVRNVGQGRLFYTNLGHTPSTWEDPKFREMLVEAVKWVTKQTDGSAEPNPDAQALVSIHSLLAAAGASGKAIPETPTQIVAKLKTAADGAWLMAKADEIEALRLGGMPSEPRKPNPKDEQKDPAKYAKDVAKYEADEAKYKPAMEKFTASRDKLVDEVLEKAGAGAAAAK